MPVMVVGAEEVVGEIAVQQMAAGGGEVRVFLDLERDDVADPGPFKTLGCKVARGALDDEGHVETALEQVHTVMHVAGRPGDDPDAWLDRCATVISAAIGAGCRRLVLLSDLAVTSPDDNAWLQALADAEDMAADAPMESVVLRAAWVYAAKDRLTRALAGLDEGQRPAGGRHWPIAAADLATVAVMADADRNLDASLHVILDVAGPEQHDTSAVLARLADVLPAAAARPVELGDDVAELLARVIERPPDALGRTGATLDDLVA